MDARALMQELTPERARFVTLARRRVARAADAEDIVQRALLRAGDRADSLHDPSRARAWFHRILSNAIADHHRARRREPTAAPSAADPDALADDGARERDRSPCACAMHLLGELRPAYAEILRRVDVDGQEPRAVASELGISEGNLHVRLHRARRTLQERVREHCGVTSHRPCLDCTCDANRRCCHD